MRVAMLDPSGFTPPYTHALCLGLAEGGNDVRLFTTPSAINPYADESYRSVGHFYRHTNRVFDAASRYRTGSKGIEHGIDSLRLIRRLQTWDPDVIHYQWFPLPVIDRFVVSALEAIAPVVHTVHDSHPFLGSPSSWLQSLFATSIRSQPTQLIAHTTYTRTQLLADGVPGTAITVIPHGLLHTDRVPDELSTGTDRILFFGSLKPYKGVDTLLRAFAALSPAVREQTTLHIAGKPAMDIQPLRSLADDLSVETQIDWELGHVEASDLGALFGQASVVALPYRRIDQSGVLLTAIAAGVPIVATNVGGISETITDGTHGILTDPDAPEAFSRGLEQVLTDRDRRDRFTSALETLRADWPSWSTIAADTVEVYRSSASGLSVT